MFGKVFSLSVAYLLHFSVISTYGKGLKLKLNCKYGKVIKAGIEGKALCLKVNAT